MLHKPPLAVLSLIIDLAARPPTNAVNRPKDSRRQVDDALRGLAGCSDVSQESTENRRSLAGPVDEARQVNHTRGGD
jgi:hypothetical protein